METKIIGIDPGLNGAITWLNGPQFDFDEMPLTVNKEVDFNAVMDRLGTMNGYHVFLERAVSFGMGTKGAFNYGRCYAALEIAIRLSGLSVTYIEPSKWTKEMHQGIDENLKPKVKSVMAVQRLLPQFERFIPKSKTGKMHEGVVDALLIAAYGKRLLTKN